MRISSEYAVAHSPFRHPHLWPRGLPQFPEGGKKAAPRVSNHRPLTPPFLQHTPSPLRCFCPSPSLRLPAGQDPRVFSPPESQGGRAGGCSPPPPPRRGSPRRGHPGAEANRPPPPACAICRLSASLRGPRSQAPAGVGELLIRPLLPGSFPGASRPLPSLWPLAPPRSYPGSPPASRGGSHRPSGRPRCCTLRDARAGEGGDLGGGSLNSGWGGTQGLGLG